LLEPEVLRRSFADKLRAYQHQDRETRLGHCGGD
jgi:hypothetical protein